MKLNKTLASVTIFFLFTSIIPVAFSSPSDDIPDQLNAWPDYALDMPRRFDRNDIDKFRELAYFTFYTFFKSGIDPDCIDLITDDDYVATNF